MKLRRRVTDLNGNLIAEMEGEGQLVSLGLGEWRFDEEVINRLSGSSHVARATYFLSRHGKIVRIADVQGKVLGEIAYPPAVSCEIDYLCGKDQYHARLMQWDEAGLAYRVEVRGPRKGVVITSHLTVASDSLSPDAPESSSHGS